MLDIHYKWAKGRGSVGLDEMVSLPQFAVAGHRQLEKIIPLSTGMKEFDIFGTISAIIFQAITQDWSARFWLKENWDFI